MVNIWDKLYVKSPFIRKIQDKLYGIYGFEEVRSIWFWISPTMFFLIFTILVFLTLIKILFFM